MSYLKRVYKEADIYENLIIRKSKTSNGLIEQTSYYLQTRSAEFRLLSDRNEKICCCFFV